LNVTFEAFQLSAELADGNCYALLHGLFSFAKQLVLRLLSLAQGDNISSELLELLLSLSDLLSKGC
jgi:hypothetical protein